MTVRNRHGDVQLHIFERVCHTCGTILSGRQKLYCSRTCVDRATYVRRREIILGRRAVYHVEQNHKRTAQYRARKSRKAEGASLGPCHVCRKDARDGHHPDYAEPEVTVALCRSCHRKVHTGRLLLTPEGGIDQDPRMGQKRNPRPQGTTI